MLQIDVDYYDANHKALLDTGNYQVLKTKERLEKFQKIGTIPRNDFLNYFLIHRHANVQYDTFNKRIALVYQAISWLEHVVDTKVSIKSCDGSNGLQERLGEAISLSVAGALFNLTAADWTVIPIQAGVNGKKTFDFERVMTGVTSQDAVVQVESKGSVVPDNTMKHQNVSAHATKICKKKVSIAKAKKYPYPAMTRYGMIAAIDATRTAKCWILDPPAPPFDSDPRAIKLANRLDYIADMVAYLAPKASLPEAIRQRAAAWRDGERGTLSASLRAPFDARNYVEKFLAKSKIWLEDLDIIGQLYQGKSGQIFFIGVQAALIRSAIKQDVEQILSTQFQPETVRASFKGAPLNLQTERKGETIDVTLRLRISSSGTVMGIGGDEESEH